MFNEVNYQILVIDLAIKYLWPPPVKVCTQLKGGGVKKCQEEHIFWLASSPPSEQKSEKSESAAYMFIFICYARS